MAKRSFPFNHCPPVQLKTHVQTKHVNNNEASLKKIYDKTQSMLKAGARAYDKNLSNGNTAQVKWTSICQYCKGSNDSKEMTKCFFCEKDICVYCYNFCFKCEQHFCPLCSIISYNDHKEKSYCLSCHHLAKM
ncbi:apoptosis regulatory protein Siva-like [Xenia sp. Carnegie-2017]|uniref:apoptosis regulatory protein Siva-like n=1 Tax=Xenia sp. Carnegie-2017 TaxID=2897299 RepID=UPI001F05025A|nr:apoptosis regulatory protein Siva-like [Xenia sp. Carnegie-2017]